MAMNDTIPVVLFRIGDRRFALPLEVVERVLRAVAVTPLPGARCPVIGLVSVHGQFCPVLDVRHRFRAPVRPVHPDDWFLLARTATRRVLLVVDGADGVAHLSAEEIDAGGAAAGEVLFSRATAVDGAIVLIHDLDRFLSPSEEEELTSALERFERGTEG